MKTKQSHFISYVSYRENLSPDHGVPEDAGVAKERQIGHVLGTVELGGVDLADGVRLVDLVLSVDIDGKLLASGEGVILDLLLRDALEVATDVLVWVGHPHWRGTVWSDMQEDQKSF